MVQANPGDYVRVGFTVTNKGSPISGSGTDTFNLLANFLGEGIVFGDSIHSGAMATNESKNFSIVIEVPTMDVAPPGSYDLRVAIYYEATWEQIAEAILSGILQIVFSLPQAIKPTADASVIMSNPNTPFGNTGDLIVALYSYYNMYDDVYIKFNIPNVPISSARLRLYVDYLNNPGRILLMSSPTTWNESTITWNNAPGAIEGLSQYVTFDSSSGYWKEIDITNYIKANQGKTISMVMIGADDPVWITFGSRESSHPPEILLS